MRSKNYKVDFSYMQNKHSVHSLISTAAGTIASFEAHANNRDCH